MAARVLTILLLIPLMVSALEKLDDSSMSDVVAQDGVRLISEYEAYIQRLALIDTDNKGDISLSGITVGTLPNQQQIIDFKIASELEIFNDMYGVGEFETFNNCQANELGCGERLGLAFFNRELPIFTEIEAIEINGNSVAKYTIIEFEVNAFSHQTNFISDLSQNEKSLNVMAYAGGADGRGIDFSIFVPKTAQLKQYLEMDGVQMHSTVRFIDADPADSSLSSQNINNFQGGLNISGLTIDGEADGMRIGLPKIQNGMIAITDIRIGNEEEGIEFDFINDMIFKDINLTGGSVLVKPGKGKDESAINLDIEVNAGSSFTYVYRDPFDQINAGISLPETFNVTGMSLNNDENLGLVVGLGHITGQIKISDLTLTPNTLTAAQRAIAPGIGELTMNLNIDAASYVHVRGI